MKGARKIADISMGYAVDKVTIWRKDFPPMNGTQFRKAIATLDMSQGEAATFLRITIKTSNNYANDKYPIPEGTAKLLRLMIKLKLKPENVK